MKRNRERFSGAQDMKHKIMDKRKHLLNEEINLFTKEFEDVCAKLNDLKSVARIYLESIEARRDPEDFNKEFANSRTVVTVLQDYILTFKMMFEDETLSSLYSKRTTMLNGDSVHSSSTTFAADSVITNSEKNKLMKEDLKTKSQQCTQYDVSPCFDTVELCVAETKEGSENTATNDKASINAAMQVFNLDFLSGIIPLIVSPWMFFFQPLALIPQLQTMNKNIKLHVESHKSTKSDLESWENNFKLSSLVAAQYHKDGKWYRALIVALPIEDPLDGEVEVFFVDYGNFEKLPPSHIISLPHEYTKLPSFAICSSLNNISPRDGGCVWPLEILSKLSNLILQHSVYECVTIQSMASDNSPLTFVNLFKNDNRRLHDHPCPLDVTQYLSDSELLQLTDSNHHALDWFTFFCNSEDHKKQLEGYNFVKRCELFSNQAISQDLINCLTSFESNKQRTALCGSDSITFKHSGQILPSNKMDHSVRTSDKLDHDHIGNNGENVCEKNDKSVNRSSRTENSKSLYTSPDGLKTGRDSTSNHSNKNPNSGISSNLENMSVRNQLDTIIDTMNDLTLDTSNKEGKNNLLTSVTYQTPSPVSNTLNENCEQSKMDKFEATHNLKESGFKHKSLVVTDELFAVYVCHIDSPSSFWVHVGKDSVDELSSFDYELQQKAELIQNCGCLAPIECLEVQTLCLVYCGDTTKKFFRSQILDFTENGDKCVVNVLLVDYGRKLTFHSRENIFQLPEYFIDFLPIMAVLCKLEGIGPAKECWSKEALNLFSGQVGNHSALKAYFGVQYSLGSTVYGYDGNPLLIDLIFVNPDGSNDSCITKLYEGGHAKLNIARDNSRFLKHPNIAAKETKNLIFNPDDEDIKSFLINEMNNDYLSSRNSYTVDTSDLEAQGEARVCKYFNRIGGCWKGESCYLSHIPG